MGHPPTSPFCLTLNLSAGMNKGEGRVYWCQPKKRTRDEDFKHSIGNYQIVRFFVFLTFFIFTETGFF